MKKSLILIIIFLFLFLGFYSIQELGLTSKSTYDPGRTLVHVTKVIDGDTFVIDNGDKVRLLCINTPEKGEFYYEEATENLKKLILNKEVIIESDITKKDNYGRLLRYVYTDSFINEKIVLDGYAKLLVIEPNSKKCSSVIEAEKIAKEKKIGLWKN